MKATLTNSPQWLGSIFSRSRTRPLHAALAASKG